MDLINGKRRAYVVRGYFTVEAALVMPVVLLCYAALVMLLCFLYERCIWEQNACRLTVWKEYVEGFVHMDPETERQITEEEICQYMLERMNEEEIDRYLLGENVYTKISDRGGYLKVDRNITYSLSGENHYGYTAKILGFEPASYLRTTKQLKATERENDDQE